MGLRFTRDNEVRLPLRALYPDGRGRRDRRAQSLDRL